MSYPMSQREKLFGVEDRARLILSPAARTLLHHGFDQVGDALRPTLGPTGGVVMIEQMVRTEPPEILSDAATAARRIVEMPYHLNTGAMLMRHLVWRVYDQVGDGTATAAVIAQALVDEATRYIAAGANPQSLRQGIESGLVQALHALETQAVPEDSLDMLGRVALAAGNDTELAKTIVEIYRKYGRNISISIQEWLANDLNVEVADGSKWSSGYVSSEFINDPERGLAWASEPYIVFSNLTLDRAEQVIPIMEQVLGDGGRDVIFFASKVEGSALAVMIANNHSGAIHSLAIAAPGEGEHRVDVLQDLAAQTGGRFISVDAGDRLERATVEDLGRCRLAWASRDFFSLIDGRGSPDSVTARLREARGKLEQEDVPFRREELRQRIGRLGDGVALLGVGAPTKSAMLERKTRAERAVRAVEAARRDGVVAGGGAALVLCAQSVDVEAPSLSLDETMGRLALRSALEAPLRTIVENAGSVYAPIIEAIQASGGRLGYDAISDKIVDVFDTGILDPYNVVRAALRHAVSAAVMLILTEAIVIPRYRLLHAPVAP